MTTTQTAIKSVIGAQQGQTRRPRELLRRFRRNLRTGILRTSKSSCVLWLEILMFVMAEVREPTGATSIMPVDQGFLQGECISAAWERYSIALPRPSGNRWSLWARRHSPYSHQWQTVFQSGLLSSSSCRRRNPKPGACAPEHNRPSFSSSMTRNGISE
jgi:hypothetical protein